MSGKQSLVGFHAPSTKAVESDASGRPMLSLTTVNRGESLAVGSDGEDGGFASVAYASDGTGDVTVDRGDRRPGHRVHPVGE